MKLLTKNAKYFGAFGLALCGGFLFESLRMDAPTVVQVSTNDNNGGKPLFSFGDEVELNIRPAFSFAPDDHPPAQLAGIASILAAEAEGLALSKQLAERRAAAAAAAPAAAGLIQPPPAPPSTISFTLKIPASSRSVQIKCASDADAESVVDAIAVRLCSFACFTHLSVCIIILIYIYIYIFLQQFTLTRHRLLPD